MRLSPGVCQEACSWNSPVSVAISPALRASYARATTTAFLPACMPAILTADPLAMACSRSGAAGISRRPSRSRREVRAPDRSASGGGLFGDRVAGRDHRLVRIDGAEALHDLEFAALR